MRISINEITSRISISRTDILVSCPKAFSISFSFPFSSIINTNTRLPTTSGWKENIFDVHITDSHITNSIRLVQSAELPDQINEGVQSVTFENSKKTIQSIPNNLLSNSKLSVENHFENAINGIYATLLQVHLQWWILSVLVLILAILIIQLLVRCLSGIYRYQNFGFSQKNAKDSRVNSNSYVYFYKKRKFQYNKSKHKIQAHRCSSIILIALYLLFRIIFSIFFSFSILFTVILLINDKNLEILSRELYATGAVSEITPSKTNRNRNKIEMGLIEQVNRVKYLRDSEINRQRDLVRQIQTTCSVHVDSMRTRLVHEMNTVSRTNLNLIYSLYDFSSSSYSKYSSSPKQNDKEFILSDLSLVNLLNKMFSLKRKGIHQDLNQYFSHYLNSVLFWALNNRMGPFKKLLSQAYKNEWLEYPQSLFNSTIKISPLSKFRTSDFLRQNWGSWPGPAGTGGVGLTGGVGGGRISEDEFLNFGKTGSSTLSDRLMSLIAKEPHPIRYELDKLRILVEHIEFLKYLNVTEVDSINSIPLQILYKYVHFLSILFVIHFVFI